MKGIHCNLIFFSKKIVIITNQTGINGSKGFNSKLKEEILGKISDIIEELDLPIYAVVAAADDIYKKPRPTIWEKIIPLINNDIIPKAEKSLFVGDAAGRPANWKPKTKKDFSCSDRKFAYNAGIDFKTPEEFFFNEKPAVFSWGGCVPKDVLSKDMPITSLLILKTLFE